MISTISFLELIIVSDTSIRMRTMMISLLIQNVDLSVVFGLESHNMDCDALVL